MDRKNCKPSKKRHSENILIKNLKTQLELSTKRQLDFHHKRFVGQNGWQLPGPAFQEKRRRSHEQAQKLKSCKVPINNRQFITIPHFEVPPLIHIIAFGIELCFESVVDSSNPLPGCNIRNNLSIYQRDDQRKLQTVCLRLPVSVRDALQKYPGWGIHSLSELAFLERLLLFSAKTNTTTSSAVEN